MDRYPLPTPPCFSCKNRRMYLILKKRRKSNWDSMLFWAGRPKLSPHNQSSFLTAQFFYSLSVSLHLYLPLWKKSTTGTISLLKGQCHEFLKVHHRCQLCRCQLGKLFKHMYNVLFHIFIFSLSVQLGNLILWTLLTNGAIGTSGKFVAGVVDTNGNGHISLKPRLM